MADEDEFLRSLRVAKDLGEQDSDPKPKAAQSRAAKKPKASLGHRRKRGARNVPFNHSVLQETAEGYITLALKHDWTMNVTLTKALELLKRADEEDKL